MVNNYAGAHTDLFSMLEAMVNGLSSGSHSHDELVTNARQMQSRLSKSHRGSLEDSTLPLAFTGGFTNSTNSSHKETTCSEKAATVLDVCFGKTNHINLKHVGQLETKLAKLFHKLVKLQASLQTTPTSPSFLLQPMRAHSCDQVVSCCETISQCCHDLLCLSLLVPTIPWPRNAPGHPELDANGIMKAMPPAIKTKKEIREAVGRACNYFVYLSDMNKMKCDSLEEELCFHKSVYALQVSYTSTLIDSIKHGYKKFETSVQDLICKPLKDILRGYNVWESTASDTALSEFLGKVHANKDQLALSIDSLDSPGEHPQGTKAVSEFGKNFFKSLAELEQECSKTRAETMKAASKSSSSY